jgi:glycosyltransferase involved in cell wall biosynthesis
MRSVWTRRPRDTLPDTLVVPLSGRNVRATEAVQRLLRVNDPVVFPMGRLADNGRRVLRGRRWEHLALVGTPPVDEIGYSLATVIALISRPRRVALIDIEHGTVVFQPLWHYLLRSAPFAVWQFFGSSVAVGVQSLALPVARRASRVRTLNPALTKLVYLRPAVGSSSGVGGSVTHSHGVIRALQGEGVRVYANTTDPVIAETAALESEPPCKWRVVATPRLTKAVPVSAALGGDVALVRAALPVAAKVDAIYQRHARFSLAGAMLAWLSRKPLILEYNGSEVYKGRYWNPTPFRRRLALCEDAAIAAAAQVIVVSEVDQRLLVEKGIEAERVLVNPNGVDASRFARDGGDETRCEHGIDRNAFVIGFVGTFGPWHGAPILAQAFAPVAEENINAHLLLVGDGPELDPTLRILRTKSLQNRTTSTGHVLPGDVPRYLDACDVLVAPHIPLPGSVDFFGSPTKLFEYMAAGKAIVASRLGQIGDVLDHGATGWLVKPGDVSELSTALRILSESPEQRRELGANARRRASERHSWQENARRIVQSYQNLTPRQTD